MSTIKVEEIQHPSNSNNAVSIASDSSVSLKHSASTKLTTTSTGVDITGVVVSGEAVFQKEITETVFAITDASSVALDPINGMIQTWTLGDNRTATDSLTTGQSMLLIITASGSNYTLTWPTMKWSGGSAPTLGGANPTAIELFKVGSQLYGATVGDLS